MESSIDSRDTTSNRMLNHHEISYDLHTELRNRHRAQNLRHQLRLLQIHFGDQSKVVQCIIHVPGRQLLSFLSFILSFATMYVDSFYVIMIYISTLHTCSFLICFNTLFIFIFCSTYLQPTRCRRMPRKTSGNIHWTLAAVCIRPEVGLPQITP